MAIPVKMARSLTIRSLTVHIVEYPGRDALLAAPSGLSHRCPEKGATALTARPSVIPGPGDRRGIAGDHARRLIANGRLREGLG